MNKFSRIVISRKTLNFYLFTLVLGLFVVPPSFALNLGEAQKLVASDGEKGDVFGSSVSIYVDTAVIGAVFDDVNGFDSGSAYVFARNSSGVWHEQQKLTASDGAADDLFGVSVSISGDTALIGASSDADNGFRSGSAYIFVRDSTGIWREQQKLTASDGSVNDIFGSSVSISGDAAIIGASWDADNGHSSGSAYVFVRDSTGMWREQQKLTPSDSAVDDEFGSAVSISGDTAVITAVFDDTDNGTDTGSAYVFVRDSTGVWREQQKLTASDGTTEDDFGHRDSVSISGDTLIIGARWDDDDGNNSGSAYIFVRDSTGMWHEQQKLTASDAEMLDEFGVSVSISGDNAVVGSFFDDDNGSRSGSAYMFFRDSAGEWREQQKLTASDGAASDQFGNSVSISGDTAVIGAFADNDKVINSGAAYMFEAVDTDVLAIEKMINNKVRATPATAAQLLAGSLHRQMYSVTNTSPHRLYQVQVFEGGHLVCNLYILDPGETKQRCSTVQTVLVGDQHRRVTVKAIVSGTDETVMAITSAYYTGHSNTLGQMQVTHYVNNSNANTPAQAQSLDSAQTNVIFKIVNTGDIELYRIKTYQDPVSPVDSGWSEQCFIGSLEPGQVRYCKRDVKFSEAGLNLVIGRAQGVDAFASPTSVISSANPTYFLVP